MIPPMKATGIKTAAMEKVAAVAAKAKAGAGGFTGFTQFTEVLPPGLDLLPELNHCLARPLYLLTGKEPERDVRGESQDSRRR